MAIRLFDSLKLEGQYLRLIVQETTASLSVAYKVLPPLVCFNYSHFSPPILMTFFESQDASPKVLKDVELLLLKNSQVVSALICLLTCRTIYYILFF